MSLKLFSIIVVLLLSLIGAILLIPKPSLLSDLSFSTAIYDDHHHLLRLTLNKDDQYRVFTPLSHISPQCIEATLLQEDQYFYHHLGINPVAIIKAAWSTFVTHSRRVGASTITMQVARLRFKIYSKNIIGKIRQIFHALQLELHYSKQEILEAYLNLAPYGYNVEGVGAASLIYFNQLPQYLSLPQALTLSVIPQNPNHRTPNHSQLQTIRNKLFARWIKIHPEDRQQEALIHLPLAMRHLHDLPFVAPHFVQQVLAQVKSAPREIVTTLDKRAQAIMEQIAYRYISRKHYLGVYNASALLVDTRNMGIKAALGSIDFFKSSISGQINGTDISRSPGSALKPFIYGLALDQGLIHPYTVLKDVPHSFGAYNPENFDYDFMGPLKARDALILSRNIPALYLANLLKRPNLYQLLESIRLRGLKSEAFYGLALNLGGAEITMQELASLYAMLVNQGIWQPLTLQANSHVIYPPRRLLSPESSFLVLDMLTQTPQPAGFATNSLVAWKTGTSSGYRDAWSVGAFGPYVLVVWIGNFNNESNPAFVGKNIAAPLFFELADAFTKELGPFPKLSLNHQGLNVKRVEVCKSSGMLPTRYCKERELTWFIPGKSPIKKDIIHREVAINPYSGLRTCHINEHTQFETYEFWSSDLLYIFKQASIARKTPPPFESGCSLLNNVGISPQITSPQSELAYVTSIKNSFIPLIATTDADIHTVYWFLNEHFLGKSLPNQAFLWKAYPGKFIVRVVDDHGLSDAREIVVQ